MYRGFSIHIYKSASTIHASYELHLGANANSSGLDKMTRTMQYLTKLMLGYPNQQSVTIRALRCYTSMHVTIMLFRKDMTPSYKNVLIPYKSYTKFMRTLKKLLIVQLDSTMESKSKSPLRGNLDMTGYTQ